MGRGKVKIETFWKGSFFVMPIIALGMTNTSNPAGVHIVSYNSCGLTDLLLWTQFNLERRLILLTEISVHE